MRPVPVEFVARFRASVALAGGPRDRRFMAPDPAGNEPSGRFQPSAQTSQRTKSGIPPTVLLLGMIEHYSAKIGRSYDNEKPHCHAIYKNARRPVLARPGLVSDRPFG
jgi:hypothetical protein